jgi:hypothetical protein
MIASATFIYPIPRILRIIPSFIHSFTYYTYIRRSFFSYHRCLEEVLESNYVHKGSALYVI